jgi:hypothetical protein
MVDKRLVEDEEGLFIGAITGNNSREDLMHVLFGAKVELNQ